MRWEGDYEWGTMSVKIHIVAGNAGVGKSSIIRALTGIRSGKQTPYLWWIQFVGPVGMQNAFVTPTSLQESFLLPWTTPVDFVHAIHVLGCSHVIIALRYNATGQRPGLADYMMEFAATGWHINYALVGRLAPLIGYPMPIILPAHTAQSPVLSNMSASILRATWGVV